MMTVATKTMKSGQNISNLCLSNVNIQCPTTWGLPYYCRVWTLLRISHTPFMLMHVHNKGLLLRSELVALHKQNALRLEPE